jgi:hypothetical protein
LNFVFIYQQEAGIDIRRSRKPPNGIQVRQIPTDNVRSKAPPRSGYADNAYLRKKAAPSMLAL